MGKSLVSCFLTHGVYRSGCRDKHNRPQCDSNVASLAPRSGALTTRLLRPIYSNSQQAPATSRARL